MIAAPPRLPSYRLHKPTGQAVVTLNGKDVYLGKHGAAESRERYDRAIAEWLANGRRLHIAFGPASGLLVKEVVAVFYQHAESYYVGPDGRPTSELAIYREALKPLRRLYGTLAAEQFGPKALKAVREEMISLGWCRNTINKQVNRLKAVFKWAVAQELVGPSVHHALQTVTALKRGRCAARESRPVRPVPDAHVAAVLPFVSRQVAALIQLQLLTGARAGELVVMRPVNINTGGDVWLYTPQHHKTAHHGHERTIYLGPQAQDLIRPFLAGRPVDRFLFSPKEAERERATLRRQRRNSPLQPSQVERQDRAARRKRRRPAGERYDVAAYRRAVARGCDRADAAAHHADPSIPAERVVVPAWHPHQLRHNAATLIRREFGIEMARLVLGHRSADVTEIYAEQDGEKAREAIRRIG